MHTVQAELACFPSARQAASTLAVVPERSLHKRIHGSGLVAKPV
jgi:hypothetical protein